MQKQKGLAPILIVILIALAVGGYFIYQNQQKSASKSTSTLQQTIQPTTQPSAKGYTISETEADGWKTYTSTEEGFSFRFPADWKENDGTSNSGLELRSPDFQQTGSKGGPFSISKGSRLLVYRTAIFDTESLEKLAQFQCNVSPEKALDYSKGYTAVAGLKAIKLAYNGCAENQFNILEIFVLKDGKAYMIQQNYPLNSENPYPDILDKVAATFKFIN